MASAPATGVTAKGECASSESDHSHDGDEEDDGADPAAGGAAAAWGAAAAEMTVATAARTARAGSRGRRGAGAEVVLEKGSAEEDEDEEVEEEEEEEEDSDGVPQERPERRSNGAGDCTATTVSSRKGPCARPAVALAADDGDVGPMAVASCRASAESGEAATFWATGGRRVERRGTVKSVNASPSSSNASSSEG